MSSKSDDCPHKFPVKLSSPLHKHEIVAYKVEFINNKAIKAVKHEKIEPWEMVEFDEADGYIKVMFIDAENEDNALQMAQKIAKNIWGIHPE